MSSFWRHSGGLWLPVPPITGGGLESAGGLGTGVAGTPAADVVSVQGVAGGTGVPTTTAAPAAANVLSGEAVQVAGGTVTLITIPAGRVWVGVISLTIAAGAVVNSARGNVLGLIATAGAGVTPAAANYLRADVELAATTATATNGQNNVVATGPHPFVVIAPAGNVVTVTFQMAINGAVTNTEATGVALGLLQ